MNYGRQEFAAAVYDGKIHVFGGKSNGMRFPYCEVHDPDDGPNGTWKMRASMECDTTGQVAASLGDKIYVVHGNYCNEHFRVYSPITDTWEYLNVNGFTVDEEGGLAFSITEQSGYGIYAIRPNKEIWRYDPRTCESTLLGWIDVNASGPKYSGYGVMSNTLYYWGGDNTHEKYTVECCF